MPEELEKHLILNSNRLRTFEDARLETVTYVEAKFVLEFVIPSRVTRDRVDTQIPLMLMRSTLSLSRVAKEKGHRVHETVVSSAVEPFSTRLQCTQEHRQAIVWQGQTEQIMVQE